MMPALANSVIAWGSRAPRGFSSRWNQPNPSNPFPPLAKPEILVESARSAEAAMKIGTPVFSWLSRLIQAPNLARAARLGALVPGSTNSSSGYRSTFESAFLSSSRWAPGMNPSNSSGTESPSSTSRSARKSNNSWLVRNTDITWDKWPAVSSRNWRSLAGLGSPGLSKETPFRRANCFIPAQNSSLLALWGTPWDRLSNTP